MAVHDDDAYKTVRSRDQESFEERFKRLVDLGKEPMRRDIAESIDEKRLEKLLMQVALTEKEAKDIIARVVSRVRATPEKTKEE